MLKRLFPVLMLLAGPAITAGTFFYFLRQKEQNLRAYIENAQKIEREFVTRVPIYEDFATQEMESNLRRYLLLDHLRIAEASGVGVLDSEKKIERLVSEGKLVAARTDEDADFHFYNVPGPLRYLTPRAKEGLDLICQRFQKNLEKRYKNHPAVRIAVSSLLRTVEYQKDLQKKNANASFASSHSYGVSFDLFYDDYYVKLPRPSPGVPEELRTRLGYLMGDALMRQFKAVLAETLLELQDEGELYAILEKNQRCYHVTVLPRK